MRHHRLTERLRGAVGILLAGACLSGCIKIEIESPDDATVVRRGDPITFQVKSSKDDDVQWYVDGAPVGQGKTFTTSSLTPGWHRVRAELSDGSKSIDDTKVVEVIDWTLMASPHLGAPSAIVRHPSRDETWLAVPGEGVHRVEDAGPAQTYTIASGLPSMDVRALAAATNTVWAATDRGVMRADTLQVYGTASGLPSDDVRQLARDAATGDLWAATPAGVARFDGTRWQAIASSLAPTALAVDDGLVWVGTAGAGLHRYVRGAWEAIPAQPDLIADTIVSLIVDTAAPRRVWVAFHDHGLAKFRDGGWEGYTHLEAGQHAAHGHSHGAENLLTAGLAVTAAERAVWLAERDGNAVFRRSGDGLWRRMELTGLSGSWQGLAVDPRQGTKWLALPGQLVALAADDLDATGLDLPNLTTVPPDDLSVRGSGSNKELRLANTAENRGAGPMKLDERNVNGAKLAIQKLYRDGKPSREQQVGAFSFHSHPHHNHDHFADFTSYQLREVLPGNAVGSILRQSAKVSFCLMDTRRADNFSAGPGSALYDCSDQGISVGWADVYAANLADQNIPIAGIPAGEYWVVSTASSVFAESDYSDNTGMTRIRLDANDHVTVLEEVRGAR